MSESLAALIEPNFTASDDRTDLLSLQVQRVFGLDRPIAYAYLLEHRSEVLAAMRTELARCEFVLRGWRRAPGGDWKSWAEELQLADPDQGRVGPLAIDVAVHVLEDRPALASVEAIETAGSQLRRLAPALAGVLDQSQRTRLGNAASEALGDGWAESEEQMVLQVARHDLVRTVEEIAPAAREELAQQRWTDALWPIGSEEVEVGPIVLRGWRRMAPALSDEAYERTIDAIPAYDRETQPLEFAEAMATDAMLRREGPYAGGQRFVKERLDDFGALNKISSVEYRDQIRATAEACVDLSPSSVQLRRLLAHIGPGPADRTRDSVRRWSAAHGKGPTATLIKDIMRWPLAGWWMETFRECKYEEAPILRLLDQVLFKEDNKVSQRVQYAAALQALGLRTKNGPTRVAKMISKLLRPGRRKHHKNDLPVALILCGAIGTEAHNQHTQISKALIAYSKRWKHQFNADENEAILEAGVSLPETYLKSTALQRLQETAEEVTARAGKWVISKVSPFS